MLSFISTLTSYVTSDLYATKKCFPPSYLIEKLTQQKCPCLLLKYITWNLNLLEYTTEAIFLDSQQLKVCRNQIKNRNGHMATFSGAVQGVSTMCSEVSFKLLLSF